VGLVINALALLMMGLNTLVVMLCIK